MHGNAGWRGALRGVAARRCDATLIPFGIPEPPKRFQAAQRRVALRCAAARSEAVRNSNHYAASFRLSSQASAEILNRPLVPPFSGRKRPIPMNIPQISTISRKTS